MLDIRALRSGYGMIEVLHGVSLSIERGQVAAVIGANGAGKSTLINTVSRLLPIRGGEIKFRDKSLAAQSAADVVKSGIVQVPEGRRLFGPLTVRENLVLGFQRLRRQEPKRFDERLAFVYELFPRVYERRDQRAVTLSGGEQQMVAIGRALMAAPELLLLDEPSLGLAPLIIDRIFDVLGRLKEQGLTMLLVEQRAEAALELADQVYVLSVGRVVMNGPPEVLRQDRSLEQAYLGGVAD
ncbi:MAG: ABC transporter ATP-binding protein [Acetobacteraceae bacterium]